MKKRMFLKNVVFLMLPLVIPLLILGIFCFSITDRYISTRANDNNINILTQTRDRADLILMDLNTLSLNFMEDPATINALRSGLSHTKFSLDEIRSLNLIQTSLNSIANAKPYIHSIYVHYQNPLGRFLTTTSGIVSPDSFYDTQWSDQIPAAPWTLLTQVREIKRYPFESNSKRLITVYKSIPEQSGTIVYNIDFNYVYSLLEHACTIKGQAMLVYDGSGRIVAGYNPTGLKIPPNQLLRMAVDEVAPLRADEHDYIISSVQSTYCDWRFFSIIPQDDLYRLPTMIRLTTAILIGLSFLLGLFLAFLITKRNYSWVHDIINILDSAEQGAPLPSFPNRGKDEYGYIIHNVLKIFIEQNYLKIQLDEKKHHQRILELTALQSQINPHFLFNTLNAVYWEVMRISGKPNQANQMLEYLTDILEYSLSDPEKQVLLETEIQHARSYVAIQKFRYKDKFDVIWDCDNPIPEVMTIKLLLQPLIENAIYHGVKEKDGYSRIKIRIVQSYNGLQIKVIDSGAGMSLETLNAVRSRLAREEDSTTEHIGLYNTYKRLRLLYGENCTLRIYSKLNFGTSIKIQIPAF